MYEFFVAGGFVMFLTLGLGFVLLVFAALHAVRTDRKYLHASVALSAVTLAAGMLGTTTGVCTTIRYLLEHIPLDKQFSVLLEGCQESLHNLVLALVILVLAGLILSVGMLRAAPVARTAAGQ
jgi:hypothetical protein